MVLRKAFDFSNWTRVPTPADIAELLALGYNTAIVGASFDPQLARDQITVLVAAGFRIEVYAWLRHPWRPDLLQNAVDACAGFPVERFWLDVEDADDATGKTPAQLAFDVEAALAYLRARLIIEIGIYTGSWFWDPYMETTDTFGCRLWLANYVVVPDITWILNRLPGGWTPGTLAIWQWANHLGGTTFNADDNLILEEDDMTPDETAAAIRAYVDPKTTALYLNALNNGADILRHGAHIEALASALAAHVAEDSVPTNNPDPAVAALLADVQKQHADLVARVEAAAAALKGPD